MVSYFCSVISCLSWFRPAVSIMYAHNACRIYILNTVSALSEHSGLDYNAASHFSIARACSVLRTSPMRGKMNFTDASCSSFDMADMASSTSTRL